MSGKSVAAIVRQAALPSNDTHFDEVDGIRRVGW